MKTRQQPSAKNAFRNACHFIRRFVGGRAARERVREGSWSYVGLFQGVIETDAHAVPPVPAQRPAARAGSRASGFLRLEVNDKKATGCFLFFVGGEVLSGAIEGASEQTGFVDASFRLSSRRSHGAVASTPRPVAAVGRLHLEDRHVRGPAVAGEDLTIRFV